MSNMQVNVFINDPSQIMRDVDYMQQSLETISMSFNDIDNNVATPLTYASILDSIADLKERVDLADNANDFYNIGGFNFLPTLLSLTENSIQAASADLIAELVQNNNFCQRRLFEYHTIPRQLLNLLKEDVDVAVRIKALYALSCLVRHNHEALVWFETSGGLHILLELLESPVEKLQMKATFLLSNIVMYEESIRDALQNIEFVPKLTKLIMESNDTNQEYLLSTLVTLVEYQDSSKTFCNQTPSLKYFLENKIKLYGELPEYWECKHHCIKLLAKCYNS